jgi:O-antigen/teichoic acid export membrane protein
MNLLHRSIFFSAAERYVSMLLFVVSTAILSRLLTPQEFGVYAVVSAVTTVIAASFQEFGGANYLIQKRDLTLTSIRTAFTIALALSALIGAILYGVGSSIARFFEQESLSYGILVSLINFLLLPFFGTVSALYRREMEFGKLAVCNLAANASGAVTSIVLAMLDFNYMAPIWGGVAANLILTLTLLAWHRTFAIFRPSLLEYRDVVGFGLYSSAVSVINVFYNLSPQLFMARILDFSAVGLYSRATGLTQVFDKLVTQILNPVIMPAIAAQRNEGTDLKGIYLRSIELLAAVQWPFLVCIAILAHPIILIWLGPTWLDVVPLVRVLCLANLALFAACLSYPVLVAVGRVRDALTSSLVSLPPSLLVILCSAFFGVWAVAASALLTLPFQAGVAIYLISRHLEIEPRDLIAALSGSFFVTLVTACGTTACLIFIEVGLVPTLPGLILAAAVTALCWWLGLVLTAHPLLEEFHGALKSALRLFEPLRRPWRSVP